MFCKIFSDDQEIATNQNIGLCDYLRTERMGVGSWNVGTRFERYTMQDAGSYR